MNLETFFEKFDQFSSAPNAVAKMRELVLSLAVRGALIPQDPRDESAQDLLRRIAPIAKIRRKDEDFSGSTAGIFPIPENWAWVRLPQVLKKLTDGTHHSPPNGPFGTFMYVTAKNIKSDGVFLDGITYVTKEVHDEIYSRCDPSFGDVLYIKDGATTGVATINQLREPFSMLSSVALLKPSDAILNRYLMWAMRSPFFYAETRGAMKGAAITRVTLSVMAASLLPLPPLAEQKRIVAKVDELMALCDRLESELRERETREAELARASLTRFTAAPTPANLEFLFHPSYAIDPADLRKSILTLAVQGKLVPFHAEGDAQSVGDHIAFQNGYAFKSEWFKPEGIRLCRNVNVGHGVLDWRDSAFVDDEIAEQFARFSLAEGDIALSLDRPLIATGLKVARIQKSDLPCLLLQRVAKPVPKHDRIDMSYFFLWLHSSAFVDSINPGRSNGVPHISTRQVQELGFALPPLAEQRRIVAKVDQLMALVDTLETDLTASRTLSQQLLESAVVQLTDSGSNSNDTG